MASPTGGQYVFSVPGQTVNLNLSSTTTFPPADPTEFDIAVYTTAPGPVPAGYEGAAFAPGGTLVNDFLEAPSVTLLNGDYQISDSGQLDTIFAGTGNQSISGGTQTTIIGGVGPLNIVAGDRNVVLLGDSVPAATINAIVDNASFAQGELIALGNGSATVFATGGDTVNAGNGSGFVHLLDSPGDTEVSLLTIVGAAAGPTYTVTAADGDSLTGAAQNVIAIAAPGDSIQIGGANATINALTGPQTIALGTGNATVFAAGTDLITAGAGSVDVAFSDNAASPLSDSVQTAIFLQGPAASPNLTVLGAGGSFLQAAAGSIEVHGQTGDTINIGAAAAVTVNGVVSTVDTVNAVFVNLGAGNTTVYANGGDTINAGAGFDTIAFGNDLAGADAITVGGGAAGGFTVASAADGPLFGTAGSLNIQAYEADTISVGTIPQVTVNTVLDTVGQLVNLGAGAATVFAGPGDTIIAGSGPGEITNPDTITAMTVAGGPGPTGINVIVASPTAGGPVFVSASTANISGAPGDSITVGSGSQTVNAISGNQFVVFGGIPGDTVNGDSIWGGTGDTIGVGGGGLLPTVGGNALVLDSSVDGAGAVGFGTFQLPGVITSTAQVTVGTVVGGAVSEGFDSVSGDFFFYPGSTDVTDAAIIAAATNTTVGTVASVQFNFLDGTQMTVIGLSSSDLTPAMFLPGPLIT